MFDVNVLAIKIIMAMALKAFEIFELRSHILYKVHIIEI